MPCDGNQCRQMSGVFFSMNQGECHYGYHRCCRMCGLRC
jgi:hypothetical protein